MDRLFGQIPGKPWKNMVGATGFEPVTRKSYKTSHFVGWVVGWKKLKPTSTLPLYQFPILANRHVLHWLQRHR